MVLDKINRVNYWVSVKTNCSHNTSMQDYSVWYQNHGGTPKDQKQLPQTPQEQGKILKGNENSKMAVRDICKPTTYFKKVY